MSHVNTDEEMKMYIWSSKALKDWGHGYIIVTAKDIDTARKMVLEQIDIAHSKIDDYGDPDRAERYRIYNKKERDLYIEDISKDPQVIESKVYFIQGSA